MDVDTKEGVRTMTLQEVSTKYSDCPFMIDGFHVPSPSLGVWLYEWERVSRSYNNSNADFIDVTIAQKDKFNWKYDGIKLSELRPIEAYIKNKISTGSNSFNITSWTPDRGYITKACYLGTPIQYIPNSTIADPEGYGTLKFEYHWIQIKGSKNISNG